MSSAQSIAYRVELTARAHADLDAIYEFIDAESSSAASTWFNGLEDLIFTLDHSPDRGARVPEDKTLRQLFHGNKPHIYRIIYAVEQDTRRVLVLHIRHGARDRYRPQDLQ